MTSPQEDSDDFVFAFYVFKWAFWDQPWYEAGGVKQETTGTPGSDLEAATCSVPTCSCVLDTPSEARTGWKVVQSRITEVFCVRLSNTNKAPVLDVIRRQCRDHTPPHPWTSILPSLSFMLTGYSLPFVFYQPLHSNFRFIEHTRLNQITSDNTVSLQILFSCVDQQMFAGYGIASSDLLPLRADLGTTVCSSVWLSHQRMSMKAWL